MSLPDLDQVALELLFEKAEKLYDKADAEQEQMPMGCNKFKRFVFTRTQVGPVGTAVFKSAYNRIEIIRDYTNLDQICLVERPDPDKLDYKEEPLTIPTSTILLARLRSGFAVVGDSFNEHLSMQTGMKADLKGEPFYLVTPEIKTLLAQISLQKPPVVANLSMGEVFKLSGSLNYAKPTTLTTYDLMSYMEAPAVTFPVLPSE